MEAQLMNTMASNINQLMQDVAFIKETISSEKEFSSHDMEEVELTDWAKKELAEARQESDSEFLSSEEVKQMILRK